MHWIVHDCSLRYLWWHSLMGPPADTVLNLKEICYNQVTWIDRIATTVEIWWWRSTFSSKMPVNSMKLARLENCIDFQYEDTVKIGVIWQKTWICLTPARAHQSNYTVDHLQTSIELRQELSERIFVSFLCWNFHIPSILTTAISLHYGLWKMWHQKMHLRQFVEKGQPAHRMI